MNGDPQNLAAPQPPQAPEPPGIYLGYPFDQLFDRNCDLEYWKDGATQKRAFIPAIKLPTQRSPGTGNIVITGPPGSGKSNLAVQWAVKCALRPDNATNAAYFSFEQTVDEVISKTKPFGWHRWMRRLRVLHETDELGNPEDLAGLLWNILLGREKTAQTLDAILARPKDPEEIDSAEDGGDPTRRLLLCSLSPRPIAEGATHEDLFWRRYQLLEHLLSAADHLSFDPTKPHPPLAYEGLKELLQTKERIRAKAIAKTSGRCAPPFHTFLPVVVLDSLNMFGLRPLNREEHFRLFSLFRKYKRIGIFVVESAQNTPFDSTMADVVVSLSHHQENGYLVQHLEIEKSRYYNQVNGLHPYKPSSLSPGENKHPPLAHQMPYEDKPYPRNQGLLVYPSLHYIVLRTEQTEEELRARDALNEPQRFGIEAMATILPPLRRQSVITIEGASGTYKTNIAMNFLATGLQNQESALLIRLGDIPWLQEDAKLPRISRELAEHKFSWEDWKLVEKEEPKEGGARWSNLVARHKTTVNVWRKKPEAASGQEAVPEPTFFELDFKGGALLPEEFVQIIRDFLNRRAVRDDQYTGKNPQRIRRVVLDDVGQIGVSYPFLRHSLTTGDTFLSAFVHLMRNAGVDLVMTATTTGLPQADEMVVRACSLADAVVSCNFCDVFGERHILVRRKGLVAGQTEKRIPDHSHEPVPAVLRLIDKSDDQPSTFVLDQDYLAGLVGFDSGRIYRPGVLLHLFQGNDTIHGKYNRYIQNMLQASFASGVPRHDSSQPDEARQLSVLPFTASRAGAIHTALTSFHRQERPLDRTVLFTVDEFGAPIDDFHRVRTQWSPVTGTLNWNEFLVAEDQDYGKQLRDGKWPGYFWPYYSNVLLLAYRTHGGPATAPLEHKSWEGVLALAKRIFAQRKELPSDPRPEKDINHLPAVERAFWVDLDAPESLACTLLDALHAAHGCTGYGFFEETREKDYEASLRPEERKEVTALTELFQMTGMEASLALQDNDQKTNKTSEESEHPPEDAGVYVLWYSQLRELIGRRPALGAHFHVCALPGLGFRGDWFLGMVRGSVSPSLGQRIVTTACGYEEDNQRYVKGVGLPARKSFYTSAFYAWPRGHHVSLEVMKHIWKAAQRRGKIKDYEKIRSNIYSLACQLTPLAGPLAGPAGQDIQAIMNTANVGRLFAQIPVLRAFGAKSPRTD